MDNAYAFNAYRRASNARSCYSQRMCQVNSSCSLCWRGCLRRFRARTPCRPEAKQPTAMNEAKQRTAQLSSYRCPVGVRIEPASARQTSTHSFPLLEMPERAGHTSLECIHRVTRGGQKKNAPPPYRLSWKGLIRAARACEGPCHA